jgi:paraquat-inducible protein A
MGTTRAHLIACEHCDAVYRLRPLARGEAARCARCHAALYRAQRLGIDAMLALTVAAAITFVIANVWPIVSLGLNGNDNAATLWQAIIDTWDEGAGLISVLAALTLFVFPMLQIAMFFWVLAFLRLRRRPPGFALLMVAIRRVRPWSMIEVFMLGTLVALAKVSDLFDVLLLPGIWAFAALTALITTVSTFDLHRLWNSATERFA